MTFLPSVAKELCIPCDTGVCKVADEQDHQSQTLSDRLDTGYLSDENKIK